ncbi:hypothetical protein L2D14_11810 [Thalassospiraceae bacterium LMO-JJ14]|nr:hypothetical protein L2D14_11810 [Thalassospiraceae bacterium LMO-JJ14]
MFDWCACGGIGAFVFLQYVVAIALVGIAVFFRKPGYSVFDVVGYSWRSLRDPETYYNPKGVSLARLAKFLANSGMLFILYGFLTLILNNAGVQ